MGMQLFECLRKTACLAPALALGVISTASASTLYVAKTGVDVSTCGATLHPCLTIQYAIDSRAVAGDVIRIQPGVYAELVTVDKNLTITGPGFTDATIDGTQTGTVVTVPSGVTATLQWLIIRNGLSVSDSPNNGGGGVNNAGTLNLNAVVVEDNSANTQDEGNFFPVVGGVVNSGVLNINFSNIANNNGSGGCSTAGGLLNFSGTVTVENSIIAGNTFSPSQCVGPGILPGASGFLNLQGTATVTTTTIWKNSVTTEGTFTLDGSTIGGSDSNGILNAGTMILVNSTISGSADSGIVNYQGEFNGTFDMSNTTVAANLGDGIDFGEFFASTVRNSILAGNGGDDCNGEFISGDYNLIQNFNSDCGFSGGGHDLTGVLAQLTKLGCYGGHTPTLVPKSGSPAINGGNPAGCDDSNGNPILVDQRGLPRPYPSGGRCDIGSVEVQ